MPTVEQIAKQIVVREGGWVKDPDDPGGATNHGVTLATLRGLSWDLDGDGGVSENDLRRLTPDQAARIFIEQYFLAPQINRLPEPLRASVFDMQVNAGLQATRLLQQLLNDMGFPCAVDGVIGPKTIEAATAAARLAGRHLVDAYGIARRNYYYALADRRPASRKYVRRKDGGKGGWITRAEEFISPRFHLTETQHRERTRKWR
ncbi:peptidoglycan-binding protein [Rubellimicrobium rubrum]|uniref:Peptidoglycan-binding protein n=1 Tax=Rubellimicrobium rubrum TaxID=2585369 RepID=A0A5C4MXJ4_9RHOB|nr:holin-associated N-acetylmuramidase [Rubellimicrobium rubrum]TNC50812.1 peptidoglycan-binding protein [Rubellimicrobium rubrum]